MITKNAFIATILTLIVSSGNQFAHAQDSVKTFVPIVNYIADVVVNTCGGIKTGALCLGSGELGVEINPWKNGQFNFTIATTHGGEPSYELVGDWQVFDNIEAGSHIFGLNAWYSHDIGKVNVKIGMQDVNDSYSACDASGNLFNTSFGGNQVLLSAGNVPTMPHNGLGINVGWKASNSLLWQAGIFDGYVLDFDNGNKFNLKHKLRACDGFVIVSEAQFTPCDEWTLKAGAFFHTGLDNNGFYASCEKSFQIQGERTINAFVSGGYAPHAPELINASITGGASLTALFSKSGADALSAGFAMAHLDDSHWETAIELNYRYQLSDHFFVSPDLQWIISPVGFEFARNALVCALRLGFEL